MSAAVLALVPTVGGWLDLPPGSPFTRAVVWMLVLSAFAALFSLATFVSSLITDMKKLGYLRRAEENNTDARAILELVKERMTATREHSEEAKATLKKVEAAATDAKVTVEQKGAEIVQAVQAAVSPSPAPPPG
jgi:hypothetical protein